MTQTNEPEFTVNELRDVLTPEQLQAVRLQKMASVQGQQGEYMP